MDISRIFSEIVLPILFYAFVTYYALYCAVKATKAIRSFKRDGVMVGAEVTGFSEKIQSYSRFKEKVYTVTVICTPPCGDEPIRYILSTKHSRGKRYAKLKWAEVCFLSKEDNAPVLPEELRTLKRLRITALFGGIFCLLFLLIILLAVVNYLVDDNLGHFLHKLFFH